MVELHGSVIEVTEQFFLKRAEEELNKELENVKSR